MERMFIGERMTPAISTRRKGTQFHMMRMLSLKLFFSSDGCLTRSLVNAAHANSRQPTTVSALQKTKKPHCMASLVDRPNRSLNELPSDWETLMTVSITTPPPTPPQIRARPRILERSFSFSVISEVMPQMGISPAV